MVIGRKMFKFHNQKLRDFIHKNKFRIPNNIFSVRSIIEIIRNSSMAILRNQRYVKLNH